jgi:hypothetical protein
MKKKDSHSFSKVTNRAQRECKEEKEWMSLLLPDNHFSLASHIIYFFSESASMAARRLWIVLKLPWCVNNVLANTKKLDSLKHIFSSSYSFHKYKIYFFRRKCRENNIYNPIIQQPSGVLGLKCSLLRIYDLFMYA